MSIIDFVNKVLSNAHNQKEVYSLGKVSNENAAIVLLSTNLDIKGYERIVDNYAIKHTLIEHGNDEIEKKRGQSGITALDFEHIETIIKNPDALKKGSERNKEVPAIEYKKIIDNQCFVYIEEVRNGKKTVCLKTMYKQKQK